MNFLLKLKTGHADNSFCDNETYFGLRILEEMKFNYEL